MNYIEDAKDLHDYFFCVRKNKDKLDKGIMVSGKVRKEVLLDINQGKIILEGRVLKIKFENMLGGVWLATIVNIKTKKV